MPEHDGSYKHIFSHPEVVADLLRGFVHEDWVEQIDYATLEKVSGSYVADDLRDRADDIIWRVRREKDWLYLYLLIEFQSRIDSHMALRIMVYTGLLYQDLVKSGRVGRSEKLPPVFPVVIYNSEGRWTAATDVAELIEAVPGSLAAYRPSQRHFVLDEGRVSEAELARHDSTLAGAGRVDRLYRALAGGTQDGPDRLPPGAAGTRAAQAPERGRRDAPLGVRARTRVAGRTQRAEGGEGGRKARGKA
jgi:hypothetical protein